MQINNIVRILQQVLQYVVYGLSPDPFKNPDHWRGVSRTEFDPLHNGDQKNVDITLKNGAAHYYYKLMNEMRDYFTKNDYHISDSVLDGKIMDLIGKCHNADYRTDLPQIIKCWLDDLDSEPMENYIIILPILHFKPFRSRKIQNIRVVELTREIFESYLHKGINSDDPIYNFNNLIKMNDTEHFFIMDINSKDVRSAKLIAEECLERFIHVVRLFDMSSFIQTRKNSYHEINESSFNFIKSFKSPGVIFDKHFTLGRIIPKKQFYDEFELYWDKLSSFLYSKHITLFQQSILTSLYWYGDIDNLRDSNIRKFLNCIIGLEKLLLKKGEHDKGKKFALRAAKIFDNDETHSDFYLSYYKRRNLLVHDQNTVIFDNDVLTLKILLRHLLLQMIIHSDDYGDVEEFMKHEYEIIM